MYLCYVVFMFTNVYYSGSTITKLRCERRRVLYDGFSMKITHEKKKKILYATLMKSQIYAKLMDTYSSVKLI